MGGSRYEVVSDPTEHREISAAHPDIVHALLARLEAVEATAFVPDRGGLMSEACDRRRYAGHYGPWLDLVSVRASTVSEPAAIDFRVIDPTGESKRG